MRPYLKIPQPLERQRQVDPYKSRVSPVYIVSSGPCLKTKQKRLNNIKLINKVIPYIVRTHLLYVSNLDNKLVSVRHAGGSPQAGHVRRILWLLVKPRPSEQKRSA